MFLRPTEPNNYKFVSAHRIDAQGKSIEVIPLPKYKHQDFSDKYSVAIVLVHDLSRPPSSFAVSVHANSFQAFGSIEEVSQEEIDRREQEYRNSFTVLYEKEFRRDEITSAEKPFRPILDKLWKAIKNGDTCFDFNEHAVDTAHNKETTMFVVNTPEDNTITISINSTLCVQELNGLYHIWMQTGNKRFASYDNKVEAEENLKDINKAIALGKRGWDLKNRKEI